MGVGALAEKAADAVAQNSPLVFGALRRIRFLIIGVPVICVIAGSALDAVFPDRHVSVARFEIGSFVNPSAPTQPVDLAEEIPMKSRMRTHARKTRQQYAGALLMTIDLEMPVVTVTANAKGADQANAFLKDVIDREIAFQNERFATYKKIVDERETLLKGLVADFTKQRDELTKKLEPFGDSNPNIGEWFALHTSRAEISQRIAGFKRELNQIKYRNAIDLLVGKSEVTNPPAVLVESAWYRPAVFGLIGLGVGVLLTLILCIYTTMHVLRRSFLPTEEEKAKAKAKAKDDPRAD
jgi:hypothetical protein